ncbi:MAG TPA: YbjN domain-containing protein [Blastocatellia bacterium]|jgi:hypothetical protein|nr:YbjN domain-containing protein [Blastocatellia bacterium]
MKNRLLITAPLALALATASATARQAEPQTPPKVARPAPRLTFAEVTRRNLQRVGATVDDNKSTADMVVSAYLDEKGAKTTVVVLNDRRKNLLGFYIYNFGNLKNAARREDVYKYLLSANNQITIGSFFVDEEEDIGYKYLVNGWQSLSQASFESVYMAMIAATREHRPEIKERLAASGGKDDKPSEEKKGSEEKPPGYRQ